MILNSTTFIFLLFSLMMQWCMNSIILTLSVYAPRLVCNVFIDRIIFSPKLTTFTVVCPLYLSSLIQPYNNILELYIFLATLHLPFRRIIYGETWPEETLKFKMESQRETRRVEGIVMHWGTEKEHMIN